MTVDDGRFLVLVGPSGCGKSTTLRALAGLEEVTEGSVWIGDREITNLPPSERDIAMVFQNYALYPHRTVRGNLRAGLEFSSDLSRDEIEQKVNEIANLLNISELLGDKPSELSGGQQQRVALGRAIVREPEVFLFDEPLSNLDARLRREMRSEISELHQTLGVTTIYVTHDQEEAMTMGDDIAVMNDGKLQQVGSPVDVYGSPANKFVAEFIGSPTINTCSVNLIDPDEFTLEFPDESNLKIGESFSGNSEGIKEETMTLGVRPENILLPPSNEADIMLDGKVTLVEPLGSNALVHIDYEHEEWVINTSQSELPEPDQTIRFGLTISDVYLFDSEGETLRSPGT